MTESTTLAARFDAAMASLPLVAVLRGITPTEIAAAAEALHGAGFRMMEVPLNSPSPFESIARLRRAMPADTLVGAGTLLEVGQVEPLRQTGAELAVMPHGDVALIRAAKVAGLLCIPGVATPTEAFAALRAGADALKLFPAEMLTPPVIKALRAVLPREARLLPVGGITPERIAAFRAAGASGVGLGSALYTPGMTAAELAQRAQRFASAWREG